MDNLPALIPLADLERQADIMARSGLFGKSPEQILSLMLIAQAEGIPVAIAAQEYDIIQGKPAITSRSALARFQAAGGSIKWLLRTDTEAKLWLYHPAGGELTVSWTIERAKKAGLVGKDNWQHYPAQMLASRAVSEGVRAIYPACLNRMYTTDEARDMDMRDVTPPPVEESPPVLRLKPEPEPEEDDKAACLRIAKDKGISRAALDAIKAGYTTEGETDYASIRAKLEAMEIEA